MGTMTKNDIIQKVHNQLGYSKKDSAVLVEQVFEIIKQNLVHGKKIKISRFGSFVVKEKQAQKGRNPQTGEEIEISARKVLTFNPSQVLRKDLNS
jgi:integration host factor subunit alpha